MKTAIYDKRGKKIAGCEEMADALEAEMLAKPLPFYAEGRLVSRIEGGLISVLYADPETARRIMRAETEGKSLTKDGFLFALLSGQITNNEILSISSRMRMPFEAVRSIAAIIFAGEAEFEDKSVLNDIFDEINASVVEMGHMRYAVIFEQRSDQGELNDICMALRDTFVNELNIDAFIGVGQPCETLAALSEAYLQALACAELGVSFSHYGGVFSYNRIFPEILLRDVPREHISKFSAAAARIRGASDEETLTLLDELFKQNLNISKTAKELYMHRNTLIYRLDKLKRITGLDVSSFDDAVILRLMLAISRLGEK